MQILRLDTGLDGDGPAGHLHSRWIRRMRHRERHSVRRHEFRRRADRARRPRHTSSNRLAAHRPVPEVTALDFDRALMSLSQHIDESRHLTLSYSIITMSYKPNGGNGMSQPRNRSHVLARVKGASGLAACVAGLVLLTGTGAGPASAATSTGSTTANAAVASSITLSGLTNAFTLSGAPNTTATTATPVTMKVTTNNTLGYAVTVQASSATMTPAGLGNTDTIASSALEVRETGTTSYSPLSALTPVTVHSQSARSASTGDTINNDYRMVIPFVNSDTYSVTLTYIATTK